MASYTSQIPTKVPLNILGTGRPEIADVPEDFIFQCEHNGFYWEMDFDQKPRNTLNEDQKAVLWSFRDLPPGSTIRPILQQLDLWQYFVQGNPV